MEVKFQGLGTALITPFNGSGGVNWSALEILVVSQINGGVNFLVPCGTTGESPTLTPDEHKKVVAYVVEKARRIRPDFPILAGTGSNSTAEAVDLTKEAKSVGATGVLVVSPYYNKPTSLGFLDYYRRIAEMGLPVILYDIPGRTGKGVPTDVILRLAEEKAICGIKWASGDINQLMNILKDRPEGLVVLSGDDNLTFPLMAMGGDGVISVLSNLIPVEITNFIGLAKNNDWAAAKQEHFHLLDLMRAMFIETNPIPVKTAMSFVKPETFKANFRSPMCEMSAENKGKLEKVLRTYSLI